MGIIGFIVFGLVVGLVARLIVPGRQKMGLFATILLGVLGSIIGAFVARALGTGTLFELNIIGALVAIAASVALVIVGERAGLVRGRRRH